MVTGKSLLYYRHLVYVPGWGASDAKLWPNASKSESRRSDTVALWIFGRSGVTGERVQFVTVLGDRWKTVGLCQPHTYVCGEPVNDLILGRVLMRSRAANAVILGSMVVEWLVRDHHTSLTRFHVLWLPEVFLCRVHVLLESAQVSFLVLQLPPPVQRHAC